MPGTTLHFAPTTTSPADVTPKIVPGNTQTSVLCPTFQFARTAMAELESLVDKINQNGNSYSSPRAPQAPALTNSKLPFTTWQQYGQVQLRPS